MKSSGGLTAGIRKPPPTEGLLDFVCMPPTVLQADSGSSCQLCLVTHTDKPVGDQKTYRQSFQVIFTKFISSGLLGYRVLCPINNTRLNPFFLLPSYSVHRLPYTSCSSRACAVALGTWNDAAVLLWGGKEYARLWPVTALPIAGSAVSLSRSIWSQKEKVERRKEEGIRFPQTTSVTEHHRSNLLEEGFSIASLKHKLTLLHHQKEQEVHSK